MPASFHGNPDQGKQGDEDNEQVGQTKIHNMAEWARLWQIYDEGIKLGIYGAG